jgi:hypothetical protein
MTIAVFALLFRYPELSMGLNPSKGGWLSVHMCAGGSFGGLRPGGSDTRAAGISRFSSPKTDHYGSFV